MKSTHWLIVNNIMWITTGVAAVLLEEPGVIVAPAIVTTILVIALATTGKIHES